MKHHAFIATRKGLFELAHEEGPWRLSAPHFAGDRYGGSTFESLRGGLPQQDCYDLVYRHGLAVAEDGVTLLMGSTTGGVWVSGNGGAHWRTVSAHLPPVYAVRFTASQACPEVDRQAEFGNTCKICKKGILVATLSDIRNTPLSGAIHIDALLDRDGLNWAYATNLPANTIRYSFSLDGYALPQSSNIAVGTSTAFTAVQQSATRGALAYLSGVTGIQFMETSAADADVHFANASITTNRVVGSFNWRSTYWEDNAGTIDRYELQGVVYLDNDEYRGYNATLNPGSQGYETLLHELGHMVGLKHPFEGAIRLPDNLDNTSNTLMSYESSWQAYSTYRDFDLAALTWLYGGDGLGGTFGIDAQGRYLVGTEGADQLTATQGNDALLGWGGDDLLDGGAGIDIGVYDGARAGFQVRRVEQGFTVAGADGNDVLRNIERLQFDDVNVALDIDGNAGAAYRLYQAALNRSPDLEGLGWWIAALDNGASLQNAAAGFMGSPEFANLYGTQVDDSTFVTLLYHNVLHREPDQAGYDFWMGALAQGEDRPMMLALFSESPENKVAIVGTISNGIDYLPVA